MQSDHTLTHIEPAVKPVSTRKARPALLLFFLSPVVGELLSGSTLPVEYLNPFIVVIHLILYGCGAIIVRELALRWKKGWPTIFVLGAAYAIAEEALLCKSFFDPNYGDVKHFAYYGRWLDVQWVWALYMTLYHVFISIAIPILLTELAFPEQRDKPWVTRKRFNAMAILLSVMVAFFYFKVSMPGPAVYLPSPAHTVVTLASIAYLGMIAKRMSGRTGASPDGKTSAPHPALLAFVAVLSVAAIHVVPGVLSSLKVHPVVPFVLGIALIYLVLRMFAGWAGSDSAWPGRYRLILQILVYAALVGTAVVLSLGSIAWLKVYSLPVIPLIIAALVIVTKKTTRILNMSMPWSDAHALALATGGLAPYIVGAFVREITSAIGAGNGWGMGLVGTVFVVFLLRLWRGLSYNDSPIADGLASQDSLNAA